MRSGPEAGDVAIDLLGAAVRAEGKGQLNIGKLLRATAAGVVRCEAAKTGFPTDSQSLVRDLRSLSRRVSAMGLDPTVAARIALGAEVIADGEQSYLDRYTLPARMEALERLGERAGWGASTEFGARLEERAELEWAMDQLPTIEQEAVTLRDLEGLSGEEAAEALGVSLAALKSRLHRGRLRLMSVLREAGVDDA